MTEDIPKQASPTYPLSMLGRRTPKPFTKQDRKERRKSLRECLKKGTSLVDKPATNITIKKPISRYDRLNALKRMPEVQEAISKMDKEKNKKKCRELFVEFFDKYSIVTKELQDIPKNKPYPYDLDGVHALCSFELDDVNILRGYRDGKHLIIAVNLTKKNEDILREFQRIIKQVRKDYRIPKDNTRNKEFTLDIWKVYDYHKKDNLNFSRIAKELSGKNENPTDNKIVRSYFMQTKRSYSEAVKIIKIVEKELKEKADDMAVAELSNNDFQNMLRNMSKNDY